jgi:hypothetical protein
VATCAIFMYVRPVTAKKEAETVLLQLIPVASLVASVLAFGATRLMLPAHMRSDLGGQQLPASATVTPFEVWATRGA